MEHMVVGLLVDTCQIELTLRDGRRLDTSDRRGDGYMYYSSFFWIDIMIIIVIIRIGRVIWDTFQMNLRKKGHLVLMDK